MALVCVSGCVGANPVRDGRIDLVEVSAPEPAAGGQVGIAVLTLPSGAVAGGAIVAERRLAVSEGELQQLWIGGDLSEARRLQPRRLLRARRLRRRNVIRDPGAIGVAEKARRERGRQGPCGIKDPILAAEEATLAKISKEQRRLI